MKWELVVAAVVWEGDVVDVDQLAVFEEVEPGVLELWAAVFWESMKDVALLSRGLDVEKLSKSQRDRLNLALEGGDPLEFLQEWSIGHLVLGLPPEMFR